MPSQPLPPLAHIPADITAVADYAAYARERMTPSAWAYLDGAAADGITCTENLAAFQRLRLQQRVLTDMVGATTQFTLLGQRFNYPIFLAPVAYHKLAHAGAEIATMHAASAMGAGMIVSAQASTKLEDIASTAQAPLWFQLYIQPDRDFTLQLVRRAEAAGYQALVLTVDAPVNGVRNQEQRAGFALPPGVEAVNLCGSPVPAHTARPGTSPVFGSKLLAGAPTWKDVQWLVQHTRLPVLLKGITHPDDALSGLDHGAEGIIVSNHGGRTLDTLPATIDMLPGIVRAVNGRAPVLLDGGIRRGSDVFKALALGASAVLVGRPYIYALAAAGAPGVAHVLHILRTELEVTMALAGTPTLADIDHRALFTPGLI
ncbi:alpha-hydroxy acid oxidase [Pusillimonas sp. ANT_WB101]|uniref:alpha-hydroxy acid oxidase n=1 Tax=Pusillimonas sp. ANT_WB101 TaxID=2597356 RepID=UPI0011ECA1FB|nr:alpha-hydroxy acid oxidase [Pusillimonas sp. ANT_WB101]KAA0911739.1 alpha-hydroxy-acid oxidizing protein [Pusillimonas sp. ANT_WB101]